MITKETIKEFFINLERDGELDINNLLLWGYFFLDSDKTKLENAANILIPKGYKLVDIFEAEKENQDDPQEYYLHIEKIERHNLESLDQKNKEFYLFAKNNNIDQYDGFDVGKVITPENII